MSRPLKLIRQRIHIKLDFERELLTGSTELECVCIQNIGSIREYQVNSRVKVTSVFVNNKDTEFYHKNVYDAPLDLSKGGAELKNRIGEALLENEQGELRIKNINYTGEQRQIKNIELGEEEEEQIPMDYEKVRIRIEYAVDIREKGFIFDQVVFINTMEMIDFGHVWSQMPPVYGRARDWVPCLDTVHDRGLIELEIDTLGYVFSSGKRVLNNFVQDGISCCMVGIVIVPTEYEVEETIFGSFVLFKPCSWLKQFVEAVMNFFSAEYGKFPFDLMHICCLPDVEGTACGIACFDSALLEPTYECAIKLRRKIMEQIAMQYMGIMVQPKTWTDMWIVLGLRLLMASEFSLRHFGKNDYKYRLKKDIRSLSETDYDQPPLNHWPQKSISFLRLKSFLVMYLITKRISKLSSNSLKNVIRVLKKQVSLNLFLKLIKKETQVDLKTLIYQYTELSGIPKIELKYAQNLGRQVIEFDLVQTNLSLLSEKQCFLIHLSVTVSELDTMYTHLLEMNSLTQHFEVKFSTKYKKRSEDCIHYIVCDLDLDNICLIDLHQNDEKFCKLFLETTNISAQIDCLWKFAKSKNQQCCQLLFKISCNHKIFIKVRQDAILGLLTFATNKFNYIGFEYLLQLLSLYTQPFSSNFLDLVPLFSKFACFQDYLIYKSVFKALALVKNEQGLTPLQIQRLLLRFLGQDIKLMNLNVDCCDHLAFLVYIVELSFVKLKPEQEYILSEHLDMGFSLLDSKSNRFHLIFENKPEFVHEAVQIIDRIRTSELLTQKNYIVLNSCLTCLARLMANGVVVTCFDVFLCCCEESFCFETRKCAFSCLFLLRAFLDPSCLEYLKLTLLNDDSKNLKMEILQLIQSSSNLDKQVVLLFETTLCKMTLDQYVLNTLSVLQPPKVKVKVKLTAPVQKNFIPPYLGSSPQQKLHKIDPCILNAEIMVVESLKFHPSSLAFLLPVPPDIGYYQIINDPMDLSCVEKRVKNGHYKTLNDMFLDVEKIFSNCKIFNLPDSPVYLDSEKLREHFLVVKQRAMKIIPEQKRCEISDETWRKLRRLCKKLRERGCAVPFLKQVQNLPGYYDKIHHPMDLGTIRRKIEEKIYTSVDQFQDDMWLIFTNCEKFNLSSEEVFENGQELQSFFLNEWRLEFPVAVNLKPDIPKVPYDYILDLIQKNPDSIDFCVPVDYVGMNLLTYPQIIKNPMDLKTIRDKLDGYINHMDFFNDLLLMLKNAVTFNSPGVVVYKCAHKLYDFIKELWKKHYNFLDFPSLTSHQEDKKRKKSVVLQKALPVRIHIPQIQKPPKSPELNLDSILQKREPKKQTKKSKRQMTPACLQKSEKLLQKLVESPFAVPFLRPVDPILDNVPNYHFFIKNPMDLQTIQQKLENYLYLEDFEQDVKQCFLNCLLFNGKDHPYTKQGLILKTMFNQEFKAIQKLHQQEKTNLQKNISPSQMQFEQTKAIRLLNKLIKHPKSHYFWAPVDPIALGIPTYFDVVKKPMDFQTIRQKIDKKVYHSMQDFLMDTKLVFDNCFLFNQPQDPVYLAGKECLNWFERECRQEKINLDKIHEPPLKKLKL